MYDQDRLFGPRHVDVRRVLPCPARESCAWGGFRAQGPKPHASETHQPINAPGKDFQHIFLLLLLLFPVLPLEPETHPMRSFLGRDMVEHVVRPVDVSRTHEVWDGVGRRRRACPRCTFGLAGGGSDCIAPTGFYVILVLSVSMYFHAFLTTSLQM
jgi:hypothetical protein